MYKTAVRALVRHGIKRLNDGDPEFILWLAAPGAAIAFPGDNSWARMHRPVEKGRRAHPTHRGIAECRTFADRFVREGIQFEIEDILVNGGPWHTRVSASGERLHPRPGRRRVQQPVRGPSRAPVGKVRPVGGLRGHRAGRGA